MPMTYVLLHPQLLSPKNKVRSFMTLPGLNLNSETTEVVKISESNSREKDHLHLLDHTIETVPQAVCLGYLWSHNLSARQGVESNINKARRHFFPFGSSGGFLGHSNLLSARELRWLKPVSFLPFSMEPRTGSLTKAA